MTNPMNERITVEALQYYVPLFQSGEKALAKLESDEPLLEAERNLLRTQAEFRDLAVDKIVALARPLMTKEINKLIAKSHLRNRDEDLFNLLFVAGKGGLVKGLRHFDVEKLDVSATNYLFQWIVTYAKKELLAAEAEPYGIAPSKFQRHKKISAVRKRLGEKLGRYAENQEVLDYFHSGSADMETMSGRKDRAGKPSNINRQMTLEMVEEQEEFERNFFTQDILDPLEDYSADSTFSKRDQLVFDETLFGAFLSSHNVTMKARVALLSDLRSASITEEERDALATLDNAEARRHSNAWRDLMKDPTGLFYRFLKSVSEAGFEEFDVASMLSVIEESGVPGKQDKWKILFENGKPRRTI